MTATEKPLVILGSHILSVEIADVAEQAGWTIEAFVENLDPGRCNQSLEGVPVIWIDDLAGLRDSHLAVFGLGTTRRGLFTDQAAALGMSFATVIHPTAAVSPRSEIGEGCVIGVRAVVAARSILGRHVFMNRGAMVGHHTEIGDFVSIQPGAMVAGACRVGDRSWIGIGSIVIDRMSVGSDVVVGAGAVVTKDVPDRVQVVGVPARVVKEGIGGR
ncbi:MAG TPA: NeuD/PglB/VioB family sugar acetyltransferase [Acidimicrobiales bacterium]|nr:NeuD/PglB/VioB family sugar acetyltransferase [Acidimicrobiales bacterium]